MSISIKFCAPTIAVFVALFAVAVPASGSDNHHQSHIHGASEHGGHVMSGSMEVDADTKMSDTVNGSIVGLDRQVRKIMIDHDALHNIGMDAMTMGFSVANDVNMDKLKPGHKISFTVEMVAGAGFQVTAIHSVQ